MVDHDRTHGRRMQQRKQAIESSKAASKHGKRPGQTHAANHSNVLLQPPFFEPTLFSTPHAQSCSTDEGRGISQRTG